VGWDCPQTCRCWSGTEGLGLSTSEGDKGGGYREGECREDRGRRRRVVRVKCWMLGHGFRIELERDGVVEDK
jgi:hypothetical protein